MTHLPGLAVPHIHDGVQLWRPLAELPDPVGHRGQGHHHQEGTRDLLHLAQIPCRQARLRAGRHQKDRTGLDIGDGRVTIRGPPPGRAPSSGAAPRSGALRARGMLRLLWQNKARGLIGKGGHRRRESPATCCTSLRYPAGRQGWERGTKSSAQGFKPGVAQLSDRGTTRKGPAFCCTSLRHPAGSSNAAAVVESVYKAPRTGAHPCQPGCMVPQ